MSNTPSSPVVIRFPQSALIFIILILALGALLLLSQGIDPNALVRARFTETPTITPMPTITPTPIDPFAATGYVSWTSQDGALSLEHPQTWLPQRYAQFQSPVSYIITPVGSTSAALVVLGATRDQVLGTNTQAPPNPTAADYLRLGLDNPKEEIRPVEIAGLQGATIKQTQSRQDATTGQVVSLDSQWWLLTLDPTHVLLVRAEASTQDWAKFQPVLDHMTSTMKVNSALAIQLMDQAFGPTGTPASTAAPTQAATQAPTVAATVAATAAATAAPTQAPTTAPAEATAVPTVAATAAP